MFLAGTQSEGQKFTKFKVAKEHATSSSVFQTPVYQRSPVGFLLGHRLMEGAVAEKMFRQHTDAIQLVVVF